jgi:hypothetical protein
MHSLAATTAGAGQHSNRALTAISARLHVQAAHRRDLQISALLGIEPSGSMVKLGASAAAIWIRGYAAKPSLNS